MMTSRLEKDRRIAAAIARENSVEFIKAAIAGDENKVRELLPICDINFVPPPHLVCLFGQVVFGVDLNGFGIDLPGLVIDRMIVENADFMIRSGGDSETMLHLAVLIDDLKLVERLLPLVDVNAISGAGKSAVDCAREYGMPHLGERILAYIDSQESGKELEAGTPQAADYISPEEKAKLPRKPREKGM